MRQRQDLKKSPFSQLFNNIFLISRNRNFPSCVIVDHFMTMKTWFLEGFNYTKINLDAIANIMVYFSTMRTIYIVMATVSFLISHKTLSRKVAKELQIHGATSRDRTADPHFTKVVLYFTPLEPTTGFEPVAYSLRKSCSATELCRL